ncbi:hypothetical protein AAHE18_18G190800 [Arachis hypogaea]|nr:uncharacterized protein DS421_18g627350 [Arachis hypogaea]
MKKGKKITKKDTISNEERQKKLRPEISKREKKMKTNDKGARAKKKPHWSSKFPSLCHFTESNNNAEGETINLPPNTESKDILNTKCEGDGKSLKEMDDKEI